MEEKAKHGEIGQTGWWVLAATVSASSMAFIDGSALNVALSEIQTDLGASGGDLLWIVNSFALFLAALLLVGGSLGDRYGRKRIYIIGIILFAIASIFCGVAEDARFLIVARAVQGIGGALMIPGSLAIVAAYFDDNTRGKAIGIWSSVTTLTSLAGPVLGGFFIQIDWWRGIFFINIPLALIAIYALTHVPESRDEEAPRNLDIIGAILITLSLAGITFGAIGIGEIGLEGFSRLDLLGSVLAGFILLIAFIVWEAKTDSPMMPLKLFRSRTFTGTNLLTLFLYGALGAALFFLPLNLIQIQGYEGWMVGLALLPNFALLMVISPYMGAIVDRYGARIPLIVGPIIVGIGFVVFSQQGLTNAPIEYFWTFLPAGILLGLGMGITVAPLTTAVMGAVPQHSAGIASGVNNAMSRSSQVLATAIMGGLALLLFSGALTSNLEALNLPADAQTALLAKASDLGNTAIPETLDAVAQAAAHLAIKESFVSMFSAVMWIAAILCWLSAALAFYFVEPKSAVNELVTSNE